LDEMEADESGGERATLRRVEGGMLAIEEARLVARVGRLCVGSSSTEEQ
jgi:hypothetical protein